MFSKLLHIKNVFLVAALIITGLNTQSSLHSIKAQQRIKSIVPSNFYGDQFEGLHNILQGAGSIGYYTGKPIDNEHKNNLAQFQQAQYTLAPVVLDLNNTDHTFVLFDCSSPAKALSTIKQLNLIPIKANKTGIILAARPDTVRR